MIDTYSIRCPYPCQKSFTFYDYSEYRNFFIQFFVMPQNKSYLTYSNYPDINGPKQYYTKGNSDFCRSSTEIRMFAYFSVEVVQISLKVFEKNCVQQL